MSTVSFSVLNKSNISLLFSHSFVFFFCVAFTDHLQGTPAILTVPVLSPCLRAEQIYITVDTHTGMLRCHVPKYLNCSVIPELETALNNDISKLPQLVSELRYWITQRRCEKTLQHLPATSFELLPLLYAPDPAMARTGRNKIFIKLHRHSNIILVVEIKEKPNTSCEMEYKFHLIFVKHIAIDEDPKAPTQKAESDVPRKYLTVQSMVEFDTFTATHGPGTYLDGKKILYN